MEAHVIEEAVIFAGFHDLWGEAAQRSFLSCAPAQHARELAWGDLSSRTSVLGVGGCWGLRGGLRLETPGT